jgi:hypothetical protein
VPHYFNTEDNAIVLKNSEEVAKLKEELEEAKIQWKHYEKLAESRGELMEKVIHETYVIVKAKL